MIELADLYLQGKMNFTTKQIARAIDENIGGWPAKAEWLMRFNSRDDDTTYYFADKDTNSIAVKKRKYSLKYFTKAMTRDEYYMLRMGVDGYKVITNHIKNQIKSRIVAAI